MCTGPEQQWAGFHHTAPQEELERCKNSGWEKTGSPVDLFFNLGFVVVVCEVYNAKWEEATKNISQKYLG